MGNLERAVGYTIYHILTVTLPLQSIKPPMPPYVPVFYLGVTMSLFYQPLFWYNALTAGGR